MPVLRLFKISAKVLLYLACIFTASLFLVYQIAFASETLFVLRLKDISDQQFSPVVGTLKESGMSYQVLEESELMNWSSGPGSKVLIPLTDQMSQPVLDKLQSHALSGGNIVLISPEEYPGEEVRKLFQTVQIPFERTVFTTKDLPLKWANTRGPATMLPLGNPYLKFQLNSNTQILATWGDEYPAILKTPVGSVLNWSWGNKLDPEADIKALQVALSAPVNVAGASQPILTASHTQTHSGNTPETAKITHSAPAPQAEAPEKVPQEADDDNVAENNTTQTPVEGSSDDDMFSFMEDDFATPEEKAVNYDTLDYGTYYMHTQSLYKYKSKIDDALETARELHLDVSVKDTEELIYQSDRAKSDFESYYLGGEPEKGLQAFRQAERYLLEAIGMISISPKTEGRAIWLDRGSIVKAGGPEGLREKIRHLKHAGINIIYFETVNAGFPIYPSQNVRQNPLIQGWDPLKVAIEEAHANDIELHAWVWAFAVGNQRHNPLIGKDLNYPGPVLTENGMATEALRNASGGYIPGSGKQHEFWLSPASPKARQFLKDLYLEIVTNYDIDGLHLDYIRYPFQNARHMMGYEAVGAQRFQASTGVTPAAAATNEQKRKVWTAWKTYQVSSFVKEVSEMVRSHKANVSISAAVFPMKRANRIIAIQQDWETWVENGWVDTISPMSYTRSPELLARVLDYVNSSPKTQPIVYSGIAVDRIETGQLLSQLNALRQKGALGSTLFAMAHLNEEKMSILAKGPFKQQKSLPPHRDPIQAMILTLEAFDGKFKILQTGGHLKLSPEEQAQIQTKLQGLQHALKEIKASYGDYQSLPAQTYFQALGHSNQFVSVAKNWTKQEQKQHPYRAQYFNELILRTEQLMGYVGGRINQQQVQVTTAQP